MRPTSQRPSAPGIGTSKTAATAQKGPTTNSDVMSCSTQHQHPGIDEFEHLKEGSPLCVSSHFGGPRSCLGSGSGGGVGLQNRNPDSWFHLRKASETAPHGKPAIRVAWSSRRGLSTLLGKMGGGPHGFPVAGSIDIKGTEEAGNLKKS